jgi:hypothetical protein
MAEIPESLPLLQHNGKLTRPGWARKGVFSYNREAIHAPRWRIKEWDYYCVLSRDYGLALTVADNGYLGFVAATWFDFVQGKECSDSIMTLMPLGGMAMPRSCEHGDVVFERKGISVRISMPTI